MLFIYIHRKSRQKEKDKERVRYVKENDEFDDIEKIIRYKILHIYVHVNTLLQS